MSLRRLFPLLALVIVLFVIFGYIKPTVDSIFEKLAEKEIVTGELATLNRVRDNFDVLSSEQERLLGQPSGRMVMEYLPAEARQEQIVDAIHLVSAHSGVVVDSLVLEDVRNAVTDEISASETAKTPTPPSAPRPGLVSMKMTFRGGYDSVREFLSGLSSVGRLHAISALSVEKEAVTEEGGSGDILSVSVEGNFLWMPERAYANAYLLPLFMNGSFDTGIVDRLLASSEESPSLPERSGTGRANPFAL